MIKEIKSKAVKRLKIAMGQMGGLERMISDEKYCIDIITQVSAIKEALTGIENMILENHLSTHVVEQVKQGNENKAVAEILKVYKIKRK